MNNLGGYQWLTTVAKKVRGPRNLVLLIATGGAVVYKSGEVLVKKSIEVMRKHHAVRKNIGNFDIHLYDVKKHNVSSEDLVFAIGEQFRVLEADGDAVLIEKIGDNNNPYFVSAELLKEISDYK